MFEQWMREFNQTRKKTLFRTYFNDLLIKWKFEDFPIILKKPTFTSYLENSTDFHFSILMVENINKVIDHLRYWFLESEQTVERYLWEINQEKIRQNYYSDFLLNAYVLVKNYIENALIPWIFEVALNIQHREKSQNYDFDLYFQYQKENLILQFQKLVQKCLKTAIRYQKEEPVLILLGRAYAEKILEKQETVVFLKKQAEK